MVTGWLSPEGLWYSCHYAGHLSTISRLLPESLNPEKDAEESGWLKSFKSIKDEEPFLFFFPKPETTRVTEAQKKTAVRWSAKRARRFNWKAESVTAKGWLKVVDRPDDAA